MRMYTLWISISLEILSLRKIELTRKYKVFHLGSSVDQRALKIKFFLITHATFRSGINFYLLSMTMWLIPWKEIPFKELVKKLLHCKFLVKKLTAFNKDDYLSIR